MARHTTHDTDAPDFTDEDDDRTPRPVDLPALAWKKARAARSLARSLEARVLELEVHLYGIDGQPSTGALSQTRSALGEVTAELGAVKKQLESVRFLQWKITAAAGLGGTVGAAVLELVLWLASRGGH
jgi:hypothetical protein